MAGSTTRRYISINPQSRENSEEIHLTNPRNQISGQISIVNPTTQELENITNIFFNKEDGQQIAESIKEDVKEELKDDYLTIESAESRFISTSQANTFALKSELEGLASEDDVQSTVQAAMGEVEETYLKKEDAATTYAKKEDVQEAIDDVKSLDEQTYLKKEDAGQLATKEELQSAEQSIESSVQQTYLSIEDASRTYLSQTDAASLASKNEVASTKQEVLGQVDGTYVRKEDVQDIVKKADFSQIAKIDTESEYTLADVVAKVNEILNILKNTEEH